MVLLPKTFFKKHFLDYIYIYIYIYYIDDIDYIYYIYYIYITYIYITEGIKRLKVLC